ncbi:TPA: hypothetical protein N2F56_004396 [Salmonella enterica]|nr:hypothetical protein [Salmonella enterica]HCL5083838.1 hypothetical protein [Salmonella enterica]
MDFLKAVLLAILIHILAPLIVHYVETNYPTNRVVETQNGKEQVSDGRALNW